MDLQQRLIEDMKTTMKNGDRASLNLIRSLRSAIHNVEIEKQKKLDDQEIQAVILKGIKQRRESIEMFKAGSRQDLVESEEHEIALLQRYLPEMISISEVETIVLQIITEVGAHSAKDKGKVMPLVMTKLRGKAEGAIINQVVNRLLP